MRRLRLAQLFSMLVAACGGERDAVPAAEPLGAVRDEHDKPFTGPIRLAELRDGRVVVYDARESRLVRVDFATRDERTIAARGDGPLEYRSALTLANAPGDSVWIFDLRRGRVLVLAPDGTPVRGFAVTDRGTPNEIVSAPWLAAVTDRGGWVGRSQFRRVNEVGGRQRAGLADSISVVRASPDGRRETVANLSTFRAWGSPPASGTRVLSSFDVLDGFAVFRDGRVMVVRGATYTPELHDADGGVTRAGAIIHQRVALTDADVRTMVDSMERMGMAMLATSLAQVQAGAGVRVPRVVLVAPDPRPEVWPLLEDDMIPVDRQDRAWVPVRDSLQQRAGQRYDLLDRDGRFLKAVRIPPRSTLVGFGEHTLYVARRDADDLLWLGRHPLPD